MLSRLLINEPPLQVLPSLAVKIGLNEAIVLQQVHYWLTNKGNKNFFDECYWVRNTYSQWGEQFPFWSKNTIRRTISALEDQKLLQTFIDTSDFRKVKFYTIDYDLLNRMNDELLQKEVREQVPESAEFLHFSRCAQSGQVDIPNMSRPYVQDGQTYRPNMSICIGPEWADIYKDTETTTENTLPPHIPPFVNLPKNDEEEELPQIMIRVWNEQVQGRIKDVHRKTVTLTKYRQKKLETLFDGILNRDLGEWSHYCELIAKTKFLLGENDTGFRVSLDWALNPDNALKVLEGKIYDKHKQEKEFENLPWDEFSKGLRDHFGNERLPQEWIKVYLSLCKKKGQAFYWAWLKDCKPQRLSGKSAILVVSTKFKKDYMDIHHKSDFEDVLKTVHPQIEDLEIKVKGGS